MPTLAQLQAQKAQIDAGFAEVKSKIESAIEKKDYGQLEKLESALDELVQDRKDWEKASEVAGRSEEYAAKLWGNADFAGAIDEPVRVDDERLRKGAEAMPLALSRETRQTLCKAMDRRANVTTKAFSTVDGLIPPGLDTQVLGAIHEGRLLDHLPVQAISTPSYSLIVHSSSTGSPGIVAEGAAKPEIILNTTAETFTAVKLAAHVGISYESQADYTDFVGYAQTELMRQLCDKENAQLLTGTGTSGNMTGFANTSGILTHDASADTGTNVTAIDSIEKSIAQLRVGSALATADLLILHPSTWSAIRLA